MKLTAQMVVRCLGKVADSYKADTNTLRTFRERGAIVYDSRLLTYFDNKVSIWALGGRQHTIQRHNVPFTFHLACRYQG